jgi:adenosine deaminase
MKAKALFVYLLILSLGAGYIFLFPKVAASAPEQKTAQYLDNIRTERPKLLAFLRKMPKGGDLHSHLSGAVYAETFLRWAVKEGLCVDNETLTLSKAEKALPEAGEKQLSANDKKLTLTKADETQSLTPDGCKQGQVRLKNDLAANDPVLYRRMVDAWSMRNWEHSGKSGHDQFFDSFGKFGEVTDRTGEMVAEVMQRAEASGISYLELMLSLDGGKAKEFGSTVGWDGDYNGMVDKLHGNTKYKPAIEAGLQSISDAEKQARAVLRCDESENNAGCKVTVRYICQVARGRPPEQVFAQMLMGFEMIDVDSKRANPRLVGINLVQPEDGVVAMQDFWLHMQMLGYLNHLYPDVKITLHAGELAPGLVPPDGLRFHIRDSIEKGHAKRIGHGVDIMQEDDAPSLLREMADEPVMVEICLSSNDKILGVRGKDHPLIEYMEYGVPVALATDDEGVARSDMTLEYMKAVDEQGLGYLQLKKMARTSLQYAFISGESLWRNTKNSFEMVPQCSQDDLDNKNISSTCQGFLASSEKANLQWKLEKAFKNFENQ